MNNPNLNAVETLEELRRHFRRGVDEVTAQHIASGKQPNELKIALDQLIAIHHGTINNYMNGLARELYEIRSMVLEAERRQNP